MREPNIEELIESLAEDNFLEGIFRRNRDICEEVSQLLYFLRKEQVETLYNKISDLNENKKQKVFTSLVNLYPLSRDIVKHLVIKREKTPVDFLRIYDCNRELLNSFRETVSEIKQSSYANSSEYNGYQKEIEKLAEEISQLENTLQKLYDSQSELSELRQKKEKLERERQEIEREYEDGRLDREIEDLEQEKKNLQAKKRKMEDVKKRLKKELAGYKEELDKNVSDSSYQKALSALANCIKAIPGEG